MSSTGISISLTDVRDGAVRHEEAASDRGWYAFAARLRGEGAFARRAWQQRYVRDAVLGDALCAGLAGAAGYLLRFGPVAQARSALVIALLLPLVWIGAMHVARSYEERFLWVGAEEFRRAFGAAMMLLAAVGTVSWAFRLD